MNTQIDRESCFRGVTVQQIDMAGANKEVHSHLPQIKAFLRSDYVHKCFCSTRIPCELTEYNPHCDPFRVRRQQPADEESRGATLAARIAHRCHPCTTQVEPRRLRGEGA